MTTERWGLFFYYPPIPLSGIRYQEKEPNGRELEELDIFFIFFRKKIRRTKRSKFNTNNITKTDNITAMYLSNLHRWKMCDMRLISYIFSKLWYWQGIWNFVKAQITVKISKYHKFFSMLDTQYIKSLTLNLDNSTWKNLFRT